MLALIHNAGLSTGAGLMPIPSAAVTQQCPQQPMLPDAMHRLRYHLEQDLGCTCSRRSRRRCHPPGRACCPSSLQHRPRRSEAPRHLGWIQEPAGAHHHRVSHVHSSESRSRSFASPAFLQIVSLISCLRCRQCVAGMACDCLSGLRTSPSRVRQMKCTMTTSPGTATSAGSSAAHFYVSE